MNEGHSPLINTQFIAIHLWLHVIHLHSPFIIATEQRTVLAVVMWLNLDLGGLIWKQSKNYISRTLSWIRTMKRSELQLSSDKSVNFCSYICRRILFLINAFIMVVSPYPLVAHTIVCCLPSKHRLKRLLRLNFEGTVSI